MFAELTYQDIFVDVCLFELGLQLLVQFRKSLAILNHSVDRIILELLCYLQLGRVLGQYLNAMLRILIVIVNPVSCATHEAHHYNKDIHLEH